jgi:hypothetical protein
MAFAAASGADSRDAYATERDAAVNHFAGQFREVIAQHYDDYAAHYNAYLGRN